MSPRDASRQAECLLCGEPTRLPTTFYLCATNSKSDSKKIVYRRIYVQLEGCRDCCRRLARIELATNVGLGAILLGGAGAALLYQFSPEWAPALAAPACLGIASIGLFTTIVSALVQTRTRTRNPELERAARGIAKRLDLGGKAHVHPSANLPKDVKPVRLEQLDMA
ncbi:hypothetical protein EP7_005561 (plasmid) [Isosphaeraceae bacterium EP7]